MKKTKEEAVLTRKMVLDAASKVFSQEGYAQATLEEVAREAGVTRGAIYWHFGNKLEMFHAVLQEYYNRANERFTRIVNSSQSPKGKLHSMMMEFFRILSDDVEFRIIEEVKLFKIRKGEEFIRLYEDHVEKAKIMRNWLKGLIKDGIAAGELNGNLDPEVIVLAMISYTAGMKSAWLSGIADVSIAENKEKLADIFFNGIVKKANPG